MKRFIQAMDYLFILRPTLLYPVWTFFLAGCWGGRHFGSGVSELAHPVSIFWIGAGLTLVMGSVYILNQIQDIETDRTNKKLFLIANGMVSVRAAYIEGSLLAILGLAFGFWVDVRMGLAFLVLFINVGWLYNFPPATWKNHFIMGLICNGLMAVNFVSVGWMIQGGPGFIHPVMAGYFLACGAVYLNTTLPDADGDRATGKITFGVRFGPTVTIRWALAMEVGAVIVAWLYKDYLLLYASLAAFPLFLWAAIKGTIPDSVRATKLSVLGLTAGVCLFFPLYLIPVFTVFFLSKLYYKQRFGLNYPNLKNA